MARVRPLHFVFLATITALMLTANVRPAHAGDPEWESARKTFRAAMKSPDRAVREDAFVELATWDGADLVGEVLRALHKEKDAGVVRSGVKALSGLYSDEAHEAMDAVLRKGKGADRLYVLAALGASRGRSEVEAVLQRELIGKDPASATQAALALGQRRAIGALQGLLAALRHNDGRVRTAAAWALARIANPPRPEPAPGEPAQAAPPVAEALRTPSVTTALIDALIAGTGLERGGLLKTLAATTGQSFGFDFSAWRKLASGAKAEHIRAMPPPVPHCLGIPVYGKRVVLVIDKSLRFRRVHPFRPEARLRKVCEVPGAPSVSHMKITFVRDFVRVHVERLLADLPAGTLVEVLLYNKTVDPLFGKLQKVGGSARRKLTAYFDELKTDDGIATWDALTAALNLGGSSPAQRWKKGPDEIIFMTVNVPTVGDVLDGNQIAQSIGLRARLAGVRIHTVGLGLHPYDLCRTLAHETFGTYQDYTK